MADHIDDGGPAFPVDFDFQVFKPRTTDEAERLMSGMSLRDHFAGLALQASISGHFAHHGHESHWPADDIASYAYEMADAMLRARKQEPSS